MFADIVRRRGAYPKADLYGGQQSRPITVWCSNDYLGMSQHPKVDCRDAECREAGGRGIGRYAQHFGHAPTTTWSWNAELAALHAEGGGASFHLGLHFQRRYPLNAFDRLLPGLVIFSDEFNHASMIEGIRRGGGAKRVFRHNDLADLEQQLRGLDPDLPKLIAFDAIMGGAGS